MSTKNSFSESYSSSLSDKRNASKRNSNKNQTRSKNKHNQKAINMTSSESQSSSKSISITLEESENETKDSNMKKKINKFQDQNLLSKSSDSKRSSESESKLKYCSFSESETQTELNSDEKEATLESIVDICYEGTVSFLLIGDLHFKSQNLHITTKMASQIITKIKILKIKRVVILGDVFDRFEHLQMRPFNIVTKWIKEITSIIGASNLYILVGNHDRINNKIYLTDESPFISMKDWKEPPVIVDKPILEQIDGLKFIFCPYVAPGRFSEALCTIDFKWNEITAVFAHQEIKHCKLSQFAVSTHGDKWSIDKCPLFSGHIHDYARLKDNIWYVGTPIQHNFGDPEDKALMLLRIGKKEMKSESTYEYKVKDINYHYHIDRYQLNIPLKVKMELTYKQAKKFVIPKNKELKLTIKSTKSEWIRLKESGKLKKIRDKGHQVSQYLIREGTKITVSFEKKSWSQRYVESLKQEKGLLQYAKGLDIHIFKL